MSPLIIWKPISAFFTRVKGITSFAVFDTRNASLHRLIKKITFLTRLFAYALFKDIGSIAYWAFGWILTRGTVFWAWFALAVHQNLFWSAWAYFFKLVENGIVSTDFAGITTFAFKAVCSTGSAFLIGWVKESALFARSTSSILNDKWFFAFKALFHARTFLTILSSAA